MGRGLPAQGPLSVQTKQRKGPRGLEGQPGLRSLHTQGSLLPSEVFLGPLPGRGSDSHSSGPRGTVTETAPSAKGGREGDGTCLMPTKPGGPQGDRLLPLL